MTEEQVQSLTYEFEAVAKKLDYLVHLTNGYSQLFHGRGTCEIEYAKHLQHQCGQPVKTKHLINRKDVPLDRLEQTMKSALTTFNEETLKVAQKHNEMGIIFIEQIAKPLENLSKSIDMNKKRIITEFISKDRRHQTLIKTAERSQENYRRLVNEYKQTSKQLETAMTQNPQIVDRLVQKKQQLTQRITQAENQYKESVQKANAFGEEMYTEPIKKNIQNALELLKTQFESMKNMMGIVSTQLNELTPIQDESFKKMKQEIDNMSYETDFAEFLKENGNQHKAYVLAVKLDETLDEKVENKPAEEAPKQEEQAKPEEEKVEEQPKAEEEQKVEEPKQQEEQPKAEEEKPEEPKQQEEVAEDEKIDLN